MSYNEKLNDRIREAMAVYPNVEEKHMFGGTCFMLNDKMCVGVIGDNMMCRVGPVAYESALEQKGAREMDFAKRPMIGYIYVDEKGYKSKKDFDYWIDLCVAYNKDAKVSKKRKK